MYYAARFREESIVKGFRHGRMDGRSIYTCVYVFCGCVRFSIVSEGCVCVHVCVCSKVRSAIEHIMHVYTVDPSLIGMLSWRSLDPAEMSSCVQDRERWR